MIYNSARTACVFSARALSSRTLLKNIKLSFICRRCGMSTKSASPSAKERGYILLVIPAVTFCLGTWQVQRRKWKLGLITQLEERTTAPPVPFPVDLAELNDLEYRKVVIRGTFDHSKELFIQPRAPMQQDSQSHGMMGRGPGKIGAHVITPFKLADRDVTVLVNRGWVPRDKLKPESRLQGQVEQEVEFIGVVRRTEKRQPGGVKNDPSLNRWFHRDVETIADILNTDAVFLDADRNSTMPGGPLGGQTRVTLRNEHLSYILTWYSLSAITFAMWYRRYWLQLR